MAKQNQVTVIEAGGNRVKMAEFEQTRSGFALSGFLCEDLAGSSEEAAAALAGAVEREGLHTGGIIACLPRQLVNIRMLDLPSSDPFEIAGMVDLQLGKQVPYSRDEVAVDSRVIGSPRDGYTRVMLLVVQRGVLREQFSLFEDAGIEVEGVTVSSQAVMHWLECAGVEAGTAEALVALDVDAEATDLVVSAGGLLQFSRSIQVGAERLNEGDDGREKLLAEVRQALEICRAEVPDLDIGRVVLTGAVAMDQDLAGWLGQNLETTVDRMSAVSVLEGHPHGPDPTGPACSAVSLASLIGAAAGGAAGCFDLFPDSVRMRRDLLVRARGLTLFGVLLMSLLFAGSLYASLKYLGRRQRLERLAQILERDGPRAERITRRRDAVRVIEQRRDTPLRMLGVVGEIHRVTPKEVHFDLVEVDMGQGRFTVRGLAPARQDVRQLIGSLEKAGIFKDVQEGGATTRDRSGRFRFQVEGKVER